MTAKHDKELILIRALGKGAETERIQGGGSGRGRSQRSRDQGDTCPELKTVSA